MAPARAGAAFATALSFPRSFARRMLRERWRISVVRRELDGEGRGEAVYKLLAGGRAFHLFVLSTVFAQNEKVDRSFGVNWDVSVALCQGEWTTEREDRLRPEIPKQYLGRYDRDTLCFARGNRSERIFDEVVDALASGRQPDPVMLAPVGYIFRTTAFAGNGQFGIRPYETLEPEHPLAEPYHVQMAAAFLLREFIFDLVDHLAGARSRQAVTLDPRIKRYLGLGNSAGQGLIPFVANHPHLIHRWCLTLELALAEARARAPAREAMAAMTVLLDKAIRYYEEDPRDGNGIFQSYATLATELRQLRARLAKGSEAASFGLVLDAATEGLGSEARELAGVILLEVFPDIIARHETGFRASEPFDIEPAMTPAELTVLIERQYAWTRPPTGKESGWTQNFWYQPEEAPDEPRRGRRGIAPDHEFETRMDVVRSVGRLRQAIAAPCPHATVADLIAARPDLRQIVRRVQSLATFDYAELRDNYLASDYTPFAAERFLLAFYGMEKLDPRPPRSVKGAFLQGAPTAADLADGRDGDMPFPLIPHIEAAHELAALKERTPLRLLETPEQTPTAIRQLAGDRNKRVLATDEVPFFSIEYRKLLVRALLVAGLPLGVAEDVTAMGEFADAITGDGLAEIMSRLPMLLARKRTAARIERHDHGARIATSPDPAFVAAPTALDLAHAAAVRSETGQGVVVLDGADGHRLLEMLAYRAARRGLAGVVGWRLADGAAGCTIAAAGSDGIALWRNAAPPVWIADAMGRQSEGPGAAIACLDPAKAKGSAADLLGQLRKGACREGSADWQQMTAGELARRLETVRMQGYRITSAMFLQLEAMSKRWLFPDRLEPAVALPAPSPA